MEMVGLQNDCAAVGGNALFTVEVNLQGNMQPVIYFACVFFFKQEILDLWMYCLHMYNPSAKMSVSLSW